MLIIYVNLLQYADHAKQAKTGISFITNGIYDPIKTIINASIFIGNTQ